MQRNLLLCCVPILWFRNNVYFSTTYGINADNFINAEFVDHSGSLFNLNDASSLISLPIKIYSTKILRVFAYQQASDFIRYWWRKGYLCPLKTLNNALDFIKDCSVAISTPWDCRSWIYLHISFSYKKNGIRIKIFSSNKLRIPWLVVVIGDKILQFAPSVKWTSLFDQNYV